MTTTSSPENSSPSVQESAAAVIAQRPEVALGAAFAGGWLVAMILRRLAS
jgi:hypothetical protein